MPAGPHTDFMSAHICFRDRLLPLLERKTSPEAIFCFLAYYDYVKGRHLKCPPLPEPQGRKFLGLYLLLLPGGIGAVHGSEKAFDYLR